MIRGTEDNNNEYDPLVNGTNSKKNNIKPYSQLQTYVNFTYIKSFNLLKKLCYKSCYCLSIF